MGKIAIHSLAIHDDVLELVENMLAQLQQANSEIYISDKIASQKIGLFDGFPIFDRSTDLSDFEAILSLGGDGTLLNTLTYVGKSELPIMGINLGRLGFLANISKDQIESALDSYFLGDFEYDDRTLISLDSDIDIFQGINYALNEFAILRKDTSSMIVVKCFINGEYLNTYWADGLMVSTPTGSTGYSLSCGGPVIMPQTNTFIITPVSPHNLNMRPLIVSENCELKFTIESRDQSFLVSMDSRSEAIDSPQELVIRKADFSARLIKVKGSSFLETLRNKLTWGLDRRN
ncbi:MAG: NAD+ kinase [Cyclobacteriaceae bacterium]|jgi:NAD+ kinase